jgi:hypothetical protein
VDQLAVLEGAEPRNAMKTALLETFCVPTEDTEDNDATSVERGETPKPAVPQEVVDRFRDLALAAGTLDEVRQVWQQASTAGAMEAGVAWPDTGAIVTLAELIKVCAGRLRPAEATA